MIPMALGITLVTLPLAICGLPLWILMDLAEGDWALEGTRGIFMDLVFLGFYTLSDI